MMAFFEGFITRFMPYLAELAGRQGSSEREYTDVHGVVDVVHSRELFLALHLEMAAERAAGRTEPELLEGVDRLRTRIKRIEPCGCRGEREPSGGWKAWRGSG